MNFVIIHMLPVKYITFIYTVDRNILDDFCGHGSLQKPCSICLQRDRCRVLRAILQLPSYNTNDKRNYLNTFLVYLSEILQTKVFYDCSSNIRENWLSRLYTRAKLFMMDLIDSNAILDNTLAAFADINQHFLSEYQLNMSVYSGNFNSILIRPNSQSKFETRFQFYFVVTLNRSVSPAADYRFNEYLTTIFNQASKTDPDPHMHSAFLNCYVEYFNSDLPILESHQRWLIDFGITDPIAKLPVSPLISLKLSCSKLILSDLDLNIRPMRYSPPSPVFERANHFPMGHR